MFITGGNRHGHPLGQLRTVPVFPLARATGFRSQGVPIFLPVRSVQYHGCEGVPSGSRPNRRNFLASCAGAVASQKKENQPVTVNSQDFSNSPGRGGRERRELPSSLSYEAI
jgi:hypothetical protein